MHHINSTITHLFLAGSNVNEKVKEKKIKTEDGENEENEKSTVSQKKGEIK